MKRNVFEYSSSDSETEAPPKKVRPFVKPDGIETLTAASVSPTTESVQDYMVIKLEEQASHKQEPGPTLEETSILKSNSIGFSMMQKMGFKIGQTLGVDNTGISEPIAVKVKKGRAGIGATRTLPRGTPITLAAVDSYISHAKTKNEEQRDRSYLLKLQKYCYQESGDDIGVLDNEILIQEVNELWRSYAAQTTSKKVGRVQLFGTTEREMDKVIQPVETLMFDLEPLSSQLNQLIAYSRKNYFYCPYCGIKFESKDDMQENCPGPYDQDHAH